MSLVKKKKKNETCASKTTAETNNLIIDLCLLESCPCKIKFHPMASQCNSIYQTSQKTLSQAIT